jgi:cytochrome c-type biogenesis protein CcmH/NrfF
MRDPVVASKFQRPRVKRSASGWVLFFCLLSIAALSLLQSSPTRAQEGDPSPLADPVKDGRVSADAVAAVASGLNCPLCQGYNLQDCPLTVCAQMRAQIARDLASGSSPEAIKASFVADYGPGVLNAPPTEGFFWLIWLAPLVALLAGALWLLRSGRRLSRAVPSSMAVATPASGNESTGSEAGEPHPSLVKRFAAMADESDRPGR